MARCGFSRRVIDSYSPDPFGLRAATANCRSPRIPPGVRYASSSLTVPMLLTGHIPISRIVTTFIRLKPRIIDPSYLRVRFEKTSEHQGILVVALAPYSQCSQPTQQKPRVERAQCRPHQDVEPPLFPAIC